MKETLNFIQVRKSLIGLLLMIMTVAACSDPKRTYVFVVDTSGSMGGKTQLLDQVKKGTKVLLKESVNDGDRVLLFAFDEGTRLVGDFENLDGEKRKSLISAIEGLQVRTRYTDMLRMILEVRRASSGLDDSSKEQVVIILSDGEDAPGRRNRRRAMIALDKFSADTTGPLQEKYVYYLNLGAKKNKNIIKSLEKNFSGKVSTIAVKGSKGTSRKNPKSGDSNDSPKSGSGSSTAKVGKDGKTIVPGQTISEGMKKVSSDLDKKKYSGYFKQNYMYGVYLALILGAALLAYLLFFLVNKLRNLHKLEGYLLYYENGMKYLKTPFRLGRIEGSRFTLGARYGANMRIKQLGMPQDFIFKGKNVKGEPFLVSQGKSATLIEFIKRENPERISFGDVFKIGNYYFEYSRNKE